MTIKSNFLQAKVKTKVTIFYRSKYRLIKSQYFIGQGVMTIKSNFLQVKVKTKVIIFYRSRCNDYKSFKGQG